MSDDPLGDLFGGLRAKSPKTDKPMPQIRGKLIGDVFYVRAHDVADALESQAPTVNRRLIDKLRSR